MKLVFLGPATVHLANWINQFVALGVDVTLITLHRDRHFDCDCQVIDLSATVRGGWGKLSYLAHVPAIARMIRDRAPDVLICYYATSYGLIGKLSGFEPRVVVAAGSDIHLHGVKRLVLEPMVRYALAGASAVACWSPAMKPRLQELGVAETHLVVQPRGVPLARYAPNKRLEGRVTIACVRRFSRIFHHETLIRACALLKQRGLPFSLVLCGDGPERARVQQMVTEHDLDQLVDDAGHVTHATVAAILNRADIYVSLADTDGASASLFEAMAAGCYPIVSAIPANAAWIESGRNGRLVDVEDFHGVADAVEQATHNVAELSRVGQVNRTFAEAHLDLRKNTEVFASLFESVASGRSAEARA